VGDAAITAASFVSDSQESDILAVGDFSGAWSVF
jgi:hypothetical protein